MPSEVLVIDYGMGNLCSVVSALDYLGALPIVSNNPNKVEQADTLILPGVGSFYKAMDRLEASRISEAIIEAVLGRKRKIMGICLGQQLFAEYSDEDGGRSGLKLINGKVSRFRSDGQNKVPHVGFNQVEFGPRSQLFRKLDQNSDFYFVHSYRLHPIERPGQTALCHHTDNFVAAYEFENLFATQFHPEKSQTNGLQILSNFLEI